MNRKFLVYWLPVILWAGVICYSSSYANPFTSPAVATVQEDVNAIDIPDVSVRPILPNRGVINLTSIVVGKEIYRRSLHVTIYLVLGFLVYRALKQHNIRWKVAATLLIAILFALSDEIHQIYTPGRSFQVLDLISDFIGALAGIGVYALLMLILKRLSKPKTSTQGR